MRSILLVDDEPSVLAALSFVFKVNGYVTTTAANGHDALALSEEADFDAALVDINMPKMDGFTFCRQLAGRVRSQERRMPAIWIMTGAHTMSAVNQAAEIGAKALLRKPFEFATLLKEMELTLDAAAGAESIDLPRPSAELAEK